MKALFALLLLTNTASAQGINPEVFKNLAKAGLSQMDRCQIPGNEVDVAFNVRLMLQQIVSGQLEVRPVAPPPPVGAPSAK